MNSLEITLSLVVSIGLFLGWVFRNKNRKIRSIYAEKITALNAQLETNKKQLRKRSTALDRYDFLKYNLLEALVVQSEIRL
ncbi:MAG: hypothetical protein AAF489_15500 [Bacteroidota bacterium]